MTKTNNETATRRIGNLPQPSKVTTLPLENKENRAAKQAAKQNSSLDASGKKVQNVIPSTSR